ncbi:MAG: DNA replication/repair protein RecF [Flavobacteriales bacterium]|nr:DNA replication/repair protein RecF [Flavobacteriales bacterium]
MHLEKLQLLNFKNYAEAELQLSPHINCFLGNNGQGKTNLLDAIFYLAFCKSFFNPIDSQLIKDEEGFMSLSGEFNRDNEKEKIHVGVKKGQKKQLKRNKKVYDKLADHIGLIPLVMISPSDSLLILEGSEVRRRFLDLIISQFNRQYLDHLIQYNKALSQRNRLLKKFMEIRRFDEVSLEVWDEQLMKYGTPIYEAREQFIIKFLPLFQKHYEFISGNKETVDLIYQSQLKEQSFRDNLLNSREKDRRLTYTSTGTHKDDLSFEIEGKSLKKFGSQGQQKTFLLSLKLAQAEFLKNNKSIAPILLLDDIYDKLDEDRVAKLMQVIQKDWFGQVFISDTHAQRLPKLFDALETDYKAFNIENGEVKSV